MADLVTIRFRRSAGERHALASVEREIRATDPKSGRKYLRDFNDAYTSYEAVLTPAALAEATTSSDILLVGDYHALPTSQRFAAMLARQIAARRPLVVGLEMVFARDQHILDEWLRKEIEGDELRERIRFNAEWGYDWEPFFEIMVVARDAGARVYGLDCAPRYDLRRIGVRDRHAADKIAEIRHRHPEAALLVLFGESHLAPNHLPQLVRERRKGDRILTVLQNLDALYWKAAGHAKPVGAVQVERGVICVFNATPLEKYESYRRCIERWRGEGGAGADVAATIYNLVDALAQFLRINRYAATNGTQPRFLVDQVPEVCVRSPGEPLQDALERKRASRAEMRLVLEQTAAQGGCYVPRLNTLFVCEFQMAAASQEVSRFLHHACRGALLQAAAPSDEAAAPEDLFYRSAVQHAVAYFGSRILYPARPPVREADLYPLYAQAREAVENTTPFGYREYMQMLDFLVLHKDYEANQRQYRFPPALLQQGISFEENRFAWVTARLGCMLGCELYEAYLAGRLTKRVLRAFYFRSLEPPGAAQKLYFDMVRRLRKPRRRLAA